MAQGSIVIFDDLLEDADLAALTGIAGVVHETHRRDPTVWFRHEDRPRCWVERVVEALRPWAPRQSSGGEWWFHMQPTDADLGLHFEKDDALARDEGVFRQPERSLILYLTDCGGPTIFTDQAYSPSEGVTPAEPSCYALVAPRRNRLVSFDSRLFHGVLRDDGSSALRQSFLVNWWSDPPREPDCVGAIAGISSARVPAGARPLVARALEPKEVPFRSIG